MAIVEAWLRRYRRGGDVVAGEAWRGRRPAVVITGGSDGIGLELGHVFAAAGHVLLLLARGADRLERAASELRDRHKCQVHVLAIDITHDGVAETIEAELDARGLYADILVNNAGIGLAGEFLSHDPRAITGLLDLNISAMTLLMRHFLPAMLERGRGGVLNIASLAGYAPGPYQAAYYASKAYVVSLSRAVAHEIRGQGVRVSVVVPGPVETRFHERMGAEASVYRSMVPAASAQSVARSAYRGFRLGLGVVYPGLLTPLLALIMRITPGVCLFPIIGLLLRPRSERNE